MCNDLDDGLFWCLVDRSDQLDEQHIALEAIIFRTGSFSEKASLLLCTTLPKTWTTGPNTYWPRQPSISCLKLKVLKLFLRVIFCHTRQTSEGNGHPMSFYSTLSRASHFALIDRDGLSHGQDRAGRTAD
jgi:hypothetical protein